ncbi:MAG: hypothetical protein R6V19_06510 [Armatimonadota bacterium]
MIWPCEVPFEDLDNDDQLYDKVINTRVRYERNPQSLTVIKKFVTGSKPDDA